jgi:tetratricopeptide (TPR) repeat protein
MGSDWRSTRRCSARLVAVTMLVVACGPSRPSLSPVSLPDLSRTDPSVQAQAKQLYADLTEKIGRRATPLDDLANAYGRLGMVLQAAEYYDAAEPCYQNAQALAPTEIRWPYFLGHLETDKGQTDKAEAFFKRVLELRPDDLAALIWLGRLYLDKGRPEAAEPLFTKALALAPRTVAVLAGLGRTALAKRDYADAAKRLEEALAIDPEADSLHSPLAIAYRGLGQPEKAAPHLKQWRNRDIFVPDPLRQELDLVLESGLSYELRGVRSLEARDFATAAAFFQKGLTLAPDNTPLRRSLQHKLGTALFMTGDLTRAQEQFEKVIRLAPPDGIDESSAKAYYSLGILMASKGRSAEAIEHLSSAVKFQPNYVEAHVALADVLRRAGRPAESFAHYQEALTINPRANQAALGYVMALAGAGRYQEARDRLTEAATLQPDRPEFAHFLARLLAAAPDARVRNGERALEIVGELLKGQKSTDLGETMAMALAEVGEFDRAAGVQRGVIEAAQRAGLAADVRRMEGNLQLYEHHRPCRTPWTDEDPLQMRTAAAGKSP